MTAIADSQVIVPDPASPLVMPPPIGPFLAVSPPAFFQAAPPGSGDRSAILSASIDTPGISRNMAAPDPNNMGGGNLNGSANAVLKLGQAGTSGQRIAVPRASAGNFTGVV